ncbi:MAG: primase-helicase family protein [Caulobacteraceae bacterium]
MNRRHFTALLGGKHYVGVEGSHPTLGINHVQWFSDGAIRRHYDRAFVEVAKEDGENAKKPLGSFWLGHPLRRAYDGVVFDPTPGRAHPRLYNRWRGWACDPNPQGTWDHLKHLLRTVLCGGDEKTYDYMLRWSAFMFQQPQLPAEVAVVARGRKGLGKGTYFRALHHLAGAHGKHILNAEHFTGRFNEHLMDCIFLFVDEGFWAGDRRHEGALKGLITEPVLTFEPKGQPIVQGPNLLHIAIASNEEWVVPATLDERRFAILDVNQNAADASSKAFFDELYRELESDGYGAMLHELLELDLGSWHPRDDVPKTLGLAEQKIESLRQNPIAYYWFQQLERGEMIFSDGPRAWRDNAIAVDSSGKDMMLSDINICARQLGRRGDITKAAVARFLRQVGVTVSGHDNNGGRIWSIPPLAQARARFEEMLGGPWQWDE